MSRDQRTRPERRYAPGPAGEVSYLVWRGGDDATAVLFLHPVNTAAAVWEPVVDQLGSSRTLIAVDYRGHGRSEATGPFLPGDYAADALAALDAAGVEAAHVVAGSIGGAVAVELAHAAPGRVASITAFGATLRLGWPPADVDAAVHGLRELGVREWFARHGAEILGPGSRPEAAAELVELASLGRDGVRGLETVVEVFTTTFARADARPAARVVSASPPPALVVVGRADPTCPPEMAHELAASLRAPVRVLERIGHLPMLEAPGATAAAIRDGIAAAEDAQP